MPLTRWLGFAWEDVHKKHPMHREFRYALGIHSRVQIWSKGFSLSLGWSLGAACYPLRTTSIGLRSVLSTAHACSTAACSCSISAALADEVTVGV